MKRKFKHLFMLCLFGMVSMGASAEIISGKCGDNAKWSYNTETCELSINGSGDMTDYTIDNTGCAPWYSYRSNIKSLSIGDQITSIGTFAFRDCSGLTSVTIPNSVTSIGAHAFRYCSGLTSVTIPNFVTSIGECAFYYCSGLTSVTIPNSVTSIGSYAFHGCSSLPVVDNVRYADTYLVGAADKTLTTCNIKEGTKWIGTEAFNGCSSLTSVTIPESVTSIGNYAFRECSCLMNVAIPNSVTEIRYGAFFHCYGLTSVTIGNSVTSIGNDVFRDCSSLTSVTLPNSVTEIDGNAFYGCSGLKDPIYNDKIFAFMPTEFKGKYNIPQGILTIARDAFYHCSGLTSVTIPNSVTLIGVDAFSGCSGLTSVYVKWKNADKIPSLHSSYNFPFSTCDLYVPTGTKAIYEGKDYWKTFKSIIEPSGQTVKISAAKYGTFGSRYAVAIPEGVSAYTATVDGSTVTMAKIKTGVIPGECGVILYAEPGDYTFAPNAEVDQIEGNQLVAVTDRTYTCTGEDVGKVYYLGLDNESKATFVCLKENGTIPVGKAYLKIDEPIEAGAKLDVVFEDTPTGITSYENDDVKAMVEGKGAYNLQGVRVNEAYKGIVIMNGKKYMNK